MREPRSAVCWGSHTARSCVWRGARQARARGLQYKDIVGSSMVQGYRRFFLPPPNHTLLVQFPRTLLWESTDRLHNLHSKGYGKQQSISQGKTDYVGFLILCLDTRVSCRWCVCLAACGPSTRHKSRSSSRRGLVQTDFRFPSSLDMGTGSIYLEYWVSRF